MYCGNLEVAGDYLQEGGLEKKKALQYTCVESSRNRKKGLLGSVTL